MPETNLTRPEAVSRYLMAHAVRTDDATGFEVTFPSRHSSTIEARFSDCNAEELGRGEDLAVRQMMKHLEARLLTGQWPNPQAWL